MTSSTQNTARLQNLGRRQLKIGRSLKFRFIFFVTLLVFITMSLVVVISINRERRIIIENVLQKINVVGWTLARAASELSPGDVNQLRDLCEIVLSDSDVTSITLKKVGGFFEEKPRESAVLFTVSDTDRNTSQGFSSATEEIVLFKDIFKMKYFFKLGSSVDLFVPFQFNTGGGGEVWINFLLGSTQSEINSMLVQNLIITGLVTCFGGLLSVLLAQFVLNPLNQLIKSTREVTGGKYTERIAITGSDEVSFLSTVFNELVESLEKKEELEQRMLNLDKLATIGQLSAGIAHEIKNPLTAIRSLVELLKEEGAVSSEFRPSVDVIIAEVERLNKVTNQFVALARPQEKKYSFFEVNPVLNNILMLLSAQFRKNGIEIVSGLNSKITIYADPDELAQAVLNIVINSIQSFPPQQSNRRITIETDDFINVCNIEISDNGCGIPKESLPKIFMPFYTSKKNGTGLGLSIVKRILDEMKSEVSVESDPGKGTRFRITIPIKSDYGKGGGYLDVI